MGAMQTGKEGEPAGRIRLAYLASHPIQYQAPMLRRIAQEPGIELTVFFASDFSVRGYRDEGFGVEVKWDIPLLEGCRHEFLPRIELSKSEGVLSPIGFGMLGRLRGRGNEAPFDALWVAGYHTLTSMLGMLAAKSLDIPILVRADVWLEDRVRSGWKLALKLVYFKMLQWLVDGVLTIGTMNHAYWTHYFGETVPLFLMPYAVDNDYFQQRSKEAKANRSALQRELQLDADRPVILFASKLQERKRCSDLLNAYAALIRRQRLSKQPYLVIVGDGEERSALEEQAKAGGLRDVRFCGFQNQTQIPRFFELCSVFVLPSRHEPWGLIVNEVMNAARPVIVSDEVGCYPDLVRDGMEGLVFPAGDVAALTAALEKVLVNPEVAAAMGRRGLERIRQWSFEEDVTALREALTVVTGKVCQR